MYLKQTFYVEESLHGSLVITLLTNSRKHKIYRKSLALCIAEFTKMQYFWFYRVIKDPTHKMCYINSLPLPLHCSQIAPDYAEFVTYPKKKNCLSPSQTNYWSMIACMALNLKSNTVENLHIVLTLENPLSANTRISLRFSYEK